VVAVDAESCTACGICFRVGCPAILKSEEIFPKNDKNKAIIDSLLCVGCEICLQVCPFHAIYRTKVGFVTDGPLPGDAVRTKQEKQKHRLAKWG